MVLKWFEYIEKVKNWISTKFEMASLLWVHSPTCFYRQQAIIEKLFAWLNC